MICTLLLGFKLRRGGELTSTSSLTGALVSFFGLRPGFGFAGITHSLEAKERKDKG